MEKSWIVCLFLGREACIGYRAEKTKKTRRKPKKPKKPKKTKSGEKCYTQRFPPGDWFFWFFWLFWFFWRETATGLRKTKKTRRKPKKPKKTKKTKVWGEMLYPKISSRGLVFLVFLVILVFFDIFLLLGSWFCEAYVGLKNQSHHFGAGQKPKPPHFNWKDPV